MKKHLSLFLAAALCLVLTAGCNGTQQPAASTPPQEGSSSQTAQSPGLDFNDAPFPYNVGHIALQGDF